LPEENDKDEAPSDGDSFMGGLPLSEKELSRAGSNFIIPISSKIRVVGHSLGVLMSKKVLEHNGFKVGQYVDVILQHRKPTRDELEAERKWKRQRNKK